MIVDATCASSNIKYPQDTELLNEACEKLEKMIEVLHDPADGKTTYLSAKSKKRLLDHCPQEEKKY